MSTVRVISLKRSVKRREIFSKLNSHVGFSFFDAVDGSQLTEEMIKETKLFHPDLDYTAGAYGSAMSHLSLWEEAIKFNEIRTIAEDDSILRFDFKEKHKEALEKLPPDWDIVLWGWNFDSVLSLDIMPDISPAVVLFNQPKLRKSIERFQSLQAEVNLLKLEKCFGLHAYSISPKGAKSFKSLCFPLFNFSVFFPLLETGSLVPNSGLDNAMNRNYGACESFCCLPPLAITKNEISISEIQNDTSIG